MSDTKVEKETKAAANTTTHVGEEQSAGPDLTVQDLQALKSIIDVASTRGAFRPNEMTAVGTVYTKLEVFLNAVASQNK